MLDNSAVKLVSTVPLSNDTVQKIITDLASNFVAVSLQWSPVLILVLICLTTESSEVHTGKSEKLGRHYRSVIDAILQNGQHRCYFVHVSTPDTFILII